MSSWEISIGFYPGILIGIRSYGVLEHDKERIDHVLYLPLVDFCLSIYKNN